MCRKALCEDVSKLVCRQNKMNTVREREDVLPNKVIIKLNMFSTSIKNWIRGHMCGVHIVTNGKGRARRRDGQLVMEIRNPCGVSTNMSQRLILSLGRRVRHSMSFLSTPRDKIGAKKHTEASS